MDQNVAKTNLIPYEIRVKKVSKRHDTAKIHEKVAAPAAGGGSENSDENLDKSQHCSQWNLKGKAVKMT